MELVSQPYKGGMNSDDNLDNLPKDDYEVGKNVYAEFGNEYLQKLKGTTDDLGGSIVLQGNFLGAFEINEIYYLFFFYNTEHYIYKYDENVTSDGALLSVFRGILDFSETELISDCILINQEVLVFNNRVDEIQKVNIKSFGYYGFDFNFDNYPRFTIGQEDGYLTFILDQTDDDFGSANFNSMFVTGFDGLTFNDLKTISPLINYRVVGTRISDTLFRTQIKVEGDVPFIGDTYYGYPNGYAGLVDLDDSPNFGYRGHPNEHYLINIPHRDAPEVSFISDATKKKNNLVRNAYKFQVQYIYNDNTKSSFSPMSQVLLNQEQNVFDFFKNNGIQVVAKNPKFYEAYQVKTVVFAVIKNQGILYEFDKIDVVRNTTAIESLQGDISTVFFDDSVLIAIEEKERLSLFDNIFPHTACIELFNKSTIGFSGIKREQDKTEVLADIFVLEEKLETVTPTDYVHAFIYPFDDGSTITKNAYLIAGSAGAAGGYIGANGPVRWFTFDNTTIKLAENTTFTGKVSDCVAPEDVLITKSRTLIERPRQPTSDKSYLFFEFSDTQTIGTIYDIEVTGQARSPQDGSYTGTIFTQKATFIAETADTQDLIDKIVSWFSIKDGTPYRIPYGVTGNYVEFFAYTQLGVTSGEWYDKFTPPAGEFSIILAAGLQSIRNKTSDYHWHQVKYMEGTINKKSFLNSNTRTLKSDSSHTIALQHYDKFNRVISNDIAGTMNIPSFITEDFDRLMNSFVFRIFNTPPTNAVRADFLYSGNADKKKTTFAVVSAVVDNGGILSVSYSFDSFNNQNAANLAYSFTAGDLIIRRRKVGAVNTYDNLEESKMIPSPIISENTGVITVLKNNDSIIAVGDLVEIVTQSISADKEDVLYFETGKAIQIVDGLYQGEKTKGDTKVFNFTRNKATGFLEATSYGFPGYVLVQIFNTNLELISEIKRTKRLEFTGTSIDDVYDIINFDFLESSPFGVVINLEWSVFNAAIAANANVNLYVSELLPTTEETGFNYNYSKLTIENFGDAYLRYRDSGYGTIIESLQKDDFSEINEWSSGRPSILNITLPTLLSTVYHSEPFFDNTTNNGISTVFDSSFFEYDSTYGAIAKMVAKGNRLYLFRRGKISIAMIDQNIINDATGSALQTIGGILSETEKFIEEDFGIGSQVHSICVNNTSIYFVDDINKIVGEIQGDRIIQLSKIKMNNYFRELLSSDGVARIMFDQNIDAVIVHFKSATVNKQVVFSNVEQFKDTPSRWISEWDLDAEFFGFLNEMFSIKKQTILSEDVFSYFIHANKADRNNIYGSQVESLIKKTFTSPRMKRFKTMMLDPLFIDKQLDITNDEGQASNLIVDDFERDGAGFWAAFYFDTNTPDLANALLKGYDLQSKNITLELKSDTNKDEGLGNIAINYDEVE